MSSTASDAPGPVTLRGLFTAASEFVRELGHVDLEQDGLSVICFHGGVQVQVTRAAANIDNRRAVVGDAASILGATARLHEHTHDGADPDVWGTLTAHGRYMETPLWCWTAVTLAEAASQGWGSMANVVELPLDGGTR
jgi:hypothetical protein